MDGTSNLSPEIELPESDGTDVEARLRKMIGNQIADAETHLALAHALSDKGDDVEAVRTLQLLIYADPQYVRAYDRLVDTLMRLGRLREASEAYREWGRVLSQRSNKVAPTPDGERSNALDTSIADQVAHYYAIRAPEYDQTSSYQLPSSTPFIDGIKSQIRAVVQDRDAIEIACGTGFWTRVASEAAHTLLATDRNVELVDMVRGRMAHASNVQCQVADAYTLDGVAGPFTAAYAQFWWSHIPRSMIKTFLAALHSKLARDARVFFMDSLPYAMRMPRRVDEEGNVVEPRVLMNGEQYEVIKNFPTESEIREALEGFADDVEYHAYENDYVWTVSYKARAAA